MKTNAIIRIILWTLVLVILVGVLAVGLLFRGYSFITDFGSESHTYTDVSEYRVDADTIRRIKIEWVNDSITIRPGDVEELVFAEPEGLPEEWRMTFVESGDHITVRYCSKKSLNFGSFGTPDKDLTVTVPRNWAGKELEIECVSADIDLRDITIESGVDIESVSGSTICDNLRCSNLDLETVSGSIRFTGEIDTLDLETVSGNCTLNARNTPKQIDMNSVSGTLNLILPADISGFTAKHNGVSGDMNCEFPVNTKGKTATYGDGACQITAESISGELNIQKSEG